MQVQNKIIHRFVRLRSDYMNPDGVYYNQIIPVNTQAFSIEFDEKYPDDLDHATLRYVLGTGASTYAEIVAGKGKDRDGNKVFSKEILLMTVSEYKDLMDQLEKVLIPEPTEQQIGQVLAVGEDLTWDWHEVVVDAGGSFEE